MTSLDSSKKTDHLLVRLTTHLWSQPSTTAQWPWKLLMDQLFALGGEMIHTPAWETYRRIHYPLRGTYVGYPTIHAFAVMTGELDKGHTTAIEKHLSLTHPQQAKRRLYRILPIANYDEYVRDIDSMIESQVSKRNIALDMYQNLLLRDVTKLLGADYAERLPTPLDMLNMCSIAYRFAPMDGRP